MEKKSRKALDRYFPLWQSALMRNETRIESKNRIRPVLARLVLSSGTRFHRVGTGLEEKRMTTKHTPKWEVDCTDVEHHCWIRDFSLPPMHQTICEMFGASPEREQRAALIAAAPELLEALTALLTFAQSNGLQFPDGWGQSVLTRSQSAITKAKAGAL